MITERRHDIDWLRVIAIGLLLIYHIAIVFQPWAMFIGFIRSEQLMEPLWTAMGLLNVWRIPLLFFVSGMGVYFAMQKRNWPKLMLDRGLRILLPYVFGLLAIVPLHIYLFQHYYKLPLSHMAHPGHLWFLANIYMYVMILSPLFYYLKKRPDNPFNRVFTALMRSPFGPLLTSVFFVAEVLVVNPQNFSLYAQTLHGLVIGFLAFFFGYLFVSSGEAFWKTVSKWWWMYLGIAAILYTLRLVEYNMAAPNYLIAIESNCWIFGIFGLGHKYLNRPGKVLTYLSQAAYPVYIIHMAALYAGCVLILPLEMAVIWKFVLINVFTFLTCLVVYEFLIRRVGILRLLHGMKWPYFDKLLSKIKLPVKQRLQKSQ